jgi:AAA family ATP:ADP antiporter
VTSLPRRLFGRAVSLHKGEATTALLMFAYSFLAMTSYNILKPITRSQFIASLGADNLPYVQLAAGVLIAGLMQLYTQVASRLPRRWIMPLTQAGEVALLVVFWFLFRTAGDWVPVAFYVLGLVLGILLISQFWTLANDIYDARQAKRVFGFIGGGASLGGATGAAITSMAVQEVGTNNLLLVSAAVLAVCVAIVTVIVRRQEITSDVAAAADERGVGGGEAVRLLRNSRHLQAVAAVIGFAAIGAAIVEQQLNMAAESAAGGSSTDAITVFLAQVTFYVSVVGFVIQVGLTSRVHRTLGLGFALLLLPVSLGATATIILLNGALWAPAAARVLDASLRYTIDKTTREVLFLPLSADLKHRAKPFVDVTVDRFAKAVGALLILVLIKPWGLSLDWQQLSYASLVMMALWVLIALRARREYLRTFRQSIETHAIAPEAVRLDLADAATIETLVEELSHPDETHVLYAIDMLDALGKRHLITPLLLHHDSSRVRSRVLRALGSTRTPVAGRWKPVVERMLKDEDSDVRAAAVHALAALSHQDITVLMRRYVDDPDPRVAATAAVALARSNDETDVGTAVATLERFIADKRDVAAAGRREAAAALARIGNPRVHALLLPLMHDTDLDVAREAIRSVGSIRPVSPLFVPGLVTLLGHRVLKPAARAVLVSGGETTCSALTYFLKDRREDSWVRRHIPATLAQFPTQETMDVLLEALEERDGFLRYKVITAIEALRRAHAELVVASGPVQPPVLREGLRYCTYLTLRYNLVQHDVERSLLARALEDKLERTLDRVYRLLGLIYPWKDVAAARFAIQHGDRRARAGAVEYLDNLLGANLRKRVIPIIDDSPMEEKVRWANLVIKSRPRDLEDTLAQLIHDDDPVVAAAAIQLVERRGMWSLADDLDYALNHRPDRDSHVTEAASWALAARAVPFAPQQLWTESVPSVELADRLRAIPLFDFVSVDELFRIAGTGRLVRHEAGRELVRQGARAGEVHFVLEGSLRIAEGETSSDIDAPVALGIEDVLEGSPFLLTVHTIDRSITLAIPGDEFLMMMSDSIVVTQGLFRMLLETPRAQQWRMVYGPVLNGGSVPSHRPPDPLEKVLVLRQNPLMVGATVKQLLALAGIARDVTLTAGSILFTDSDPPAVYCLLAGEVCLEGDAVTPVVAGPGSTVGMLETLAGVSLGRRAAATRDGYALRLDREELFDVLADHADLVQGLFSGLLQAKPPEAASVAAGAASYGA